MAEEEDMEGSRWERSGDDDGSAGKSDEGLTSPFPLPTRNTEDSDWYLGSWLQGRHKVFDHFGFRDCDSAHHKEDQERVVAGMRPAHLQNKHCLLAIRALEACEPRDQQMRISPYYIPPDIF